MKLSCSTFLFVEPIEPDMHCFERRQRTRASLGARGSWAASDAGLRGRQTPEGARAGIGPWRRPVPLRLEDCWRLGDIRVIFSRVESDTSVSGASEDRTALRTLSPNGQLQKKELLRIADMVNIDLKHYRLP
jgi:hypothetical protein